MTRISFIVPTFNRAHFIEETLRAILSQAGPRDEVIVVDDGSTDRTPDVVRSLGDRVRYVRQDNAGKSIALNFGLCLAGGEYIWICDDDDILLPGAVERLASAIETSSAGFVFGRHSRFRQAPDGTRTGMDPGYWPDLTSGSVLRHLMEDAYMMQNATLARRSCYDAVGPFDKTMLRSLDYEMFVRLALGFPGQFVDAFIFDQRKHDGARGPASALHASIDSERVWLEYDRRIFQRAFHQVPLAVYEAMYAGGDAAAVRRAACLQRACVSARHDMWPQAIDDLEAAAAASAAPSLQPVEEAICRRVLSGKYGFSGALEAPVRDRLKRMLKSGGAGAAIIRAMIAGALWRLRRAEGEDVRETSRILLEVAGPVEALKIMWMHKFPPPVDLAGGSLLTERDVLPIQHIANAVPV